MKIRAFLPFFILLVACSEPDPVVETPIDDGVDAISSPAVVEANANEVSGLSLAGKNIFTVYEMELEAAVQPDDSELMERVPSDWGVSTNNVFNFIPFTLELHSFQAQESGPQQYSVLDTTQRELMVDVRVGEYAYDHFLQLLPTNANLTGLTADFQFTNVITIRDEEGYLPLEHWKTHTSEWQALRHVNDDIWFVPTLASEDWNTFPDYTMVELEEAIRQSDNEHFKDDTQIDDSRMHYTGIRLLRIRVNCTFQSGREEQFVLALKFATG